MIKLKIPKVRMIIGVEISFKIGFIIKFNKPRTIPAITKPFRPLLTTNPGTSQWAIPKAMEFEKSLIIKGNITTFHDTKKDSYGQWIVSFYLTITGVPTSPNW